MERQVELHHDADVVSARATGREVARDAGFGLADQTRLATAISELARNALVHAGGGVCAIAVKSTADQIAVIVTVQDRGPGIPDLGQAFFEGFSTRGRLGAGLPGAKRLVHHLDIHSDRNGTQVTIEIRRVRS